MQACASASLSISLSFSITLCECTHQSNGFCFAPVTVLAKYTFCTQCCCWIRCVVGWSMHISLSFSPPRNHYYAIE